jgi:hypothetical protein
MGEERNVYRVSMGKPEGKKPLGRPRRRWEDGIRMDLRKIGWGSVDWIQLAQDATELVTYAGPSKCPFRAPLQGKTTTTYTAYSSKYA